MNKEELIHSMEYVDERLIQEADAFPAIRKRNARIRWSVLAACLAVVFYSLYMGMGNRKGPDSPVDTETSAHQVTEEPMIVETAAEIPLETSIFLKEPYTQLFMATDRYGWALSETRAVYQTSSGEAGFHPVLLLPVTEEMEPSVCFIDDHNAVVVYAEGGQLMLAKTGNRGSSWQQIPITLESMENVSEVFAAFADDRQGLLLCCGDAALGRMEKRLYRTEDGGEQFTEVADLSEVISEYPTGIAWGQGETVFLTTAHRGLKEHLFSSVDGGVNWEACALPVDGIYDAYPPVFFDKERMNGQLVLHLVLADGEEWSSFRTTDGGVSWTQETVYRNYTTAFLEDYRGRRYLMTNQGGYVRVQYEE